MDEREGRVDVSSFFSCGASPCWEVSGASCEKFIGFRGWKVKFQFVLPAQGASRHLQCRRSPHSSRVDRSPLRR